MLILTRRTNETIVIDGPARITVTQIQGNRVRLGIVAGPDVTADREEIHLRRQPWIDSPDPTPAAA